MKENDYKFDFFKFVKEVILFLAGIAVVASGLKFLGLPVHIYGVMFATGILMGTLLISYKVREYAFLTNNKELQENWLDFTLDIILVLVTSGIIGAKLLYIISNKPPFPHNWVQLKYYLLSGFVFYGGVIGAAIGLYIYSKVKKMDFLTLTDIVVPGLPFGHIFGRIGCFFNGCCYGKACSCEWGCYCAHTGNPAIDNVLRHPTQLYEATALIFITYLVWKASRKWEAKALPTYLISYGVWRFLVEFIRGDNRGLQIGGLWISQWVSIIGIIIGVGMLFYVDSGKRKSI